MRAKVLYKRQDSCLILPHTCFLTVQLSQIIGDNCTKIQSRMSKFKTILILIQPGSLWDSLM